MTPRDVTRYATTTHSGTAHLPSTVVPSSPASYEGTPGPFTADHAYVGVVPVSPHVRTRAGVALHFGWPEDAAARCTLDALAQDRDEQVRGIIAVELRWGEQNGMPPGVTP